MGDSAGFDRDMSDGLSFALRGDAIVWLRQLPDVSFFAGPRAQPEVVAKSGASSSAWMVEVSSASPGVLLYGAEGDLVLARRR